MNRDYLIKYGKIGYVSGIILYTGLYCYKDSVQYLIKYRNPYNSISNTIYFENQYINNEGDACKHGIYINFISNFIHSLYWPCHIIIDIFSNITLLLNPLSSKNSIK